MSRQTISNWENDKSYPDVNNLILLSDVFKTSIDNLIKGDIEIMKKQIQSEDQKKFGRISKMFSGLLIATIILPVPLAHYGGYIGIVAWIIIAAITFYLALQVEKQKKRLISKLIVKFLLSPRELDLITSQRPEKKVRGCIKRYYLL